MCFWTQVTFKWNNLWRNTSKFCQNERVTHFLQSWKILLWGTGVVEFVAPHHVVNVWHWNPVVVLKSRTFSKISCFVWFICQKLRAVFSSISAQNCSRKKYSFWGIDEYGHYRHYRRKRLNLCILVSPEIQRLPFFSSLDWSSLHKHPPPFVPRPDDITDTTYFDGMCSCKRTTLI